MSITLNKFLPERKEFVIPCPLKPPATYRDIIRYAKRLAGIMCAREGVPPPKDVLIRASVKPRKDSNFRWFLSSPVAGIYDFINERIVLAKWIVDVYLKDPTYRNFCDYIVGTVAHETRHHIQYKTMEREEFWKRQKASENEREASNTGIAIHKECVHRCIYKR